MNDFTKNFEFKKQLGQNFLTDQNIIERITKAIRSFVLPSTKILEIGPGVGAVTQRICQKNFVYAVELDDQILWFLKQRNLPNVQFIFADGLKLNWENYLTKNDLLFSNTPYCISTALLSKYIFSSTSCVGLFLVQKEVFEKISAKVNSKHYSAYSVFCQTFLDLKDLFLVKSTAFYPMPKVDSTFFQFQKKRFWTLEKMQTYWKFLTSCFCMRRKTLQNNLKNSQFKSYCGVLEEKFFSFKTIRAQELTPEQFINFFENYDLKN